MNITIYSTTTCSFCHALMSWLDSKNVSYTKKVTDEDDAALAEFMSVSDGAMGVPFSVIEDESGNQTKIIGFDRAKFQQVLGI